MYIALRDVEQYCMVVYDFDSIQRQLEGNIPDDQLWDSSSYLVESVFQTLRKMFTNAREIQVATSTFMSRAPPLQDKLEPGIPYFF